jgi:hypothetical protein
VRYDGRRKMKSPRLSRLLGAARESFYCIFIQITRKSISIIDEICAVIDDVFLPNKPNFEIIENTVSDFFRKTNDYRLSTSDQKSKPNQTQFLWVICGYCLSILSVKIRVIRGFSQKTQKNETNPIFPVKLLICPI